MFCRTNNLGTEVCDSRGITRGVQSWRGRSSEGGAGNGGEVREKQWERSNEGVAMREEQCGRCSEGGAMCHASSPWILPPEDSGECDLTGTGHISSWVLPNAPVGIPNFWWSLPNRRKGGTSWSCCCRWCRKIYLTMFAVTILIASITWIFLFHL